MKLDIHAHILPEHLPDWKEKFGYGGFITVRHREYFAAAENPNADSKPRLADMHYDDGRFFRTIEENCWDAHVILRDMDNHQTDVVALCTVPVMFNYWAKPEHALETSRFLNDHLAEVQENFPKRIIGLGTVPLQDTALAIREMERCKRELRFPGLQIGSNVNGMNLDDESLFPFYEAAESLGVCLMVHPWEMLGEKELQKYWMRWLVGMPAETTRAICSMMFGSVFDKFPNLRVMFVHAGGSFPHTMGRIIHGYECRPDLVNVNLVQHPREYVGKFWIDGITHDAEALRYVVKLFGEKRVAYGTDYPFPLGDLEHGKFIHEIEDFSDEKKEAIFSGAALEFLGLTSSYFK